MDKNIFKRIHPILPEFLVGFSLKTHLLMATSYQKKKQEPESISQGSIANLLNCFLENSNFFADVLLLWTLYKLSQTELYIPETQYSLLFTMQLVAILIPYFISYSSGIQILINEKLLFITKILLRSKTKLCYIITITQYTINT